MAATFRKKESALAENAFRRWSTQILVARTAETAKRTKDRELKKAQEDLKSKEKELEALEKEIEEQGKKGSALQSNVKENKRRIAEGEDKQRQLSEQISALIYKNTTEKIESSRSNKNIEERVRQLELQINELKLENRELREKLDSTENNVGTFIRDMGSLLDTHEIANFAELLQEEVVGAGNDAGEDEELEGGGSTGGSIRKDGGVPLHVATSYQRKHRK